MRVILGCLLVFLLVSVGDAQREVPDPVIPYTGEDLATIDVTCAASSTALLTAHPSNRSITLRNIGTADVWICWAQDAAAPPTCTSSIASLFLRGGTFLEAVTLDVATYQIALSCITDSGTARIKGHIER
jgi:hypothetical protein